MPVLKSYPEYKDSSIPWLGEVPEHWKIDRLKLLVNNINEQTDNRHANDLYIALENIESWTGRIRQNDPKAYFESQVKRFHVGDILFGRLRPYLAKVARPMSDGVCVGELLVLRPRNSGTIAPYVEQLIRSKPIIDAINSSTFGAKMPRADWQFIGGMAVTLPPPIEQLAIVRFLDHMDRRIRRYISTKQKLIKLLEEQKQVIIHQAVTRGLDSSVPLKPSGVEWLGDIPEHWEVVRNGRLFNQRNETGYSELPILEVSLRTGVSVRDFESSDRKQIMNDRDKYKRATKGDIAYNMMRMWQGAVGVVPIDGLVSPAYVVARPMKWTESRYFGALFHTAEYMGEVDKYSHGIVKDRNRLYWEDFKQMQSTFPPLNEQIIIADAIDKNTTELEVCIKRTMHEISLLTEYRARLISDVVTGKLDVRGIDIPATIGADVPEEYSDLLDADVTMEDQVIQEEITIGQEDGE